MYFENPIKFPIRGALSMNANKLIMGPDIH